MKSPPQQFTDDEARSMTEAFIAGEVAAEEAVVKETSAKKAAVKEEPVLEE